MTRSGVRSPSTPPVPPEKAAAPCGARRPSWHGLPLEGAPHPQSQVLNGRAFIVPRTDPISESAANWSERRKKARFPTNAVQDSCSIWSHRADAGNVLTAYPCRFVLPQAAQAQRRRRIVLDAGPTQSGSTGDTQRRRPGLVAETVGPMADRPHDLTPPAPLS